LLDFKPAAQAFMKQRAAEHQNTNVCHGEYGWPVADLLSEPMKIVQAPRETMILYEIDNLHRQVFTDGRQFPAYLGYSTGRWEGDTLVVETRGFNDRTPLVRIPHELVPDNDIFEMFCQQNEKDRPHMQK
jgi:hypothetical protein